MHDPYDNGYQYWPEDDKQAQDETGFADQWGGEGADLSLYAAGVGVGKSQYTPNGALPLTFAGEEYAITGGPYYGKPADALGIKLAVEIDEDCHIDLPIRDFDVPAQHEMEVGVIQTITLLLEFGKEYELYAGCMGGMGRTGLLFACIVKVEQELNRRWWDFRKSDPVERVRKTYYSHAVETQDQQEFVTDFDAKAVANFLKRRLTN